MRPSRQLAVLLASLCLACVSSVEEDLAACIGIACTAGTCFSDGAGQPMCVCSASEAAAGLSCEVEVLRDEGDLGYGTWTPLTPGGEPFSAAIERMGTGAPDVDQFEFVGQPGHLYMFECAAEGFTCHVDALRVRLLDYPYLHDRQLAVPGGLLVGVHWPGMGDQVTSPGPRTYYVRLRASVPEGYGPYRVRVVDLGLEDFADTDELGRWAAPGPVPVTGRFEVPTDTDVVRLSLQAGVVLGIRCTRSGTTTPPSVALQRSGGTSWSDHAGGWKTEGAVVSTTYEVGQTGEFVLRVSPRPEEPVRGAGTGWACDLTHAGTDDHGDASADATVVQVPASSDTTVSGRFETPGDTDCFRIPVTAGRGYALRGLSPWDVQRGTLGGMRATSMFNPPVTPFYAQSTGAQLLCLSPLDDRVQYSFQVADLGPDDHAPVGPAATSLAGLQSASGRLLPAGTDEDAFQFGPPVGEVYQVNFNSTYAPASWVYERPRLTVRDGDLAVATDVAAGSLRVKRTGAGTQPLSFAVKMSTSWGTSFVGEVDVQYTLHLGYVGTDDHADVAAQATLLGSALQLSGRLDAAADADWFALELAARSYAVTTTGAAGVLHAFAADGVTPLSLTSTGEGAHTLQVPAAGRVYLRLLQQGTSPSWESPYTLTLQ